MFGARLAAGCTSGHGISGKKKKKKKDLLFLMVFQAWDLLQPDLLLPFAECSEEQLQLELFGRLRFEMKILLFGETTVRTDEFLSFFFLGTW